MDAQAYLQRINYTGSLEPNLSTLMALIKAHMLVVPFENLDIHNNIPIYMDPDAQFEKIVVRRRGGFCYELNSLFRQLLEAIGYDTIIVSGRIYNYERGKFGPEFDHMAIIVEVGTQIYLVDVGYGEFAFTPLILDFQIDQPDPRGLYRVRVAENEYMMVSRVEAGAEKALYLFSLVPRKLWEFEGMCKYQQTSAASRSRQQRICTVATEHGRKTLSGNSFTVTYGKGEIEVELETEEAVRDILMKEFGIELLWMPTNGK